MSIGTSVLRGLNTSVQCPGYLVVVGWVFLPFLCMPDSRLQFCSLRCRVLSSLSVYTLAQDLVPAGADLGVNCKKGTSSSDASLMYFAACSSLCLGNT